MDKIRTSQVLSRRSLRQKYGCTASARRAASVLRRDTKRRLPVSFPTRRYSLVNDTASSISPPPRVFSRMLVRHECWRHSQHFLMYLHSNEPSLLCIQVSIHLQSPAFYIRHRGTLPLLPRMALVSNKGSKMWGIENTAVQNLERCLQRLGCALHHQSQPLAMANPFLKPWYTRDGPTRAGDGSYTEVVSTCMCTRD
jgi:hypothetical protein